MTAETPTGSYVSAQWLAEHIDDGTAVVLDAAVTGGLDDNDVYVFSADKAAYEQEHLPSAHYADVIHDFSDTRSALKFARPTEEGFQRAARAVGVNNDSIVVIYDHELGIWAARLWQVFRAFGHDHVFILSGGVKAWREAGQPVTTDQVGQPAEGNIVAKYREGYFVDKQDVQQIVAGEEEALLVNVLSPEEFEGKISSYARKGHIPGSVNLPVSELFDPQTAAVKPGHVESQEAIQTKSAAARVVTYCGGGIAASGYAAALHDHGIDNVAVYDGSMEEWAADDSLPLVTGPASA